MAEVREGWDLRLNRPVAVKQLYPQFTADSDNLKRFENEAQAAAGLCHPHIVAVHDSGYQDSTPYIVMERLSGHTLADAIARGPLPQAQVVSILDGILSALSAAHSAGILHRDVKPANILFTDTGDVKVADFGIAKSDLTPHTMVGQIVGTVAYLSPERLAGMPATPADDLYAVGVVGYEALTGVRPYPGCAPLSAARTDVAPAVAAAIDKALSPDPRQRFQHADSMRAALAGRPDASARRPPTKVLASPLPDPATMLVAPKPRRTRTRTVIGMAAAGVAAVIVVAAVIADSASRAPTPTPAGTTSTSSTPPPPPTTPSLLPPTPSAPAQLEPAPPRKGSNGKGENGNGNQRKKPKGDND
jgi:serine/threonine-protein kinase